MMLKKECFFLILWIVLFSQAFSQKAWRLDDCIDYALKHNLSIQQKEINTKINKIDYNQSKLDVLPYASANSGAGFYFGRSIDPTTNDIITIRYFSNSYSVGSSVTLFSGFSKINRISYNKFICLAGKEEEKELENKVAFEVMNAFYDAVFYQGLYQIAQQQKELSELNLKNTQSLVKAGLKAKTDLLEIEAKLAAEELQLTRTKNLWESSLLLLKQIMDFPEGEPFDIENSFLYSIFSVEDDLSAESIYRIAISHHPGIKAMEARLMASRKSLLTNMGYLLPSLSLSGSYGTGFYETRKDNTGKTIPFKDQIRMNAGQSIRLSIGIPIFGKWNGHAKLKRAKLNYIQSETELEIREKDLYNEIEKAIRDLLALEAEYKQALKKVEASDVAFELSEKKYNQGLINIIELYSTKNDLANARSDVLRSRTQLEIKLKTIDFFKGIFTFSLSL